MSRRAGPFSYLEAGSSAPLVFLHGIGGGARSWTPQIDALKDKFRIIAWDMPGYGTSLPLEETTFPALSDAFSRFLSELGLTKAHIAGHSIGGMVAQEFAAGQPDRVESLVLSATSPAFGRPDGDFQKKFVAARLQPLESGKSMRDVANVVVPELVGPKAGQAGQAQAIDCMSAVPPETYAAMMRCLVTFDRRDALGRLSMPVLVLSGEHDTNAPPPMMEKMASKIPGARYRCLPGLGHLANLEQPAAFNDALTAFIDNNREETNHVSG